MDNTDLILIQKLLGNSRQSYHTIANDFGITVNAIHKRVQRLIDVGTIQAFTAKPNIAALKAVRIIIFGISSAKSVEEAIRELGSHDCSDHVIIGSDKYIHIVATLRDISEMQSYVTFATRVCQITNPTVAIFHMFYPSLPSPLSQVDYRIIHALNRDARRSAVDLSLELGLSTKTINNRIKLMQERHLVDFSIDYNPTFENINISIFHIRLPDSKDTEDVRAELMRKFPKNVQFCYSFTNIPHFLIATSVAPTLQELQAFLKLLEQERFEEVTPRFAYNVLFFQNWRDKLIK